MNILVADDDRISREILLKSLKTTGHTVRAASNGEEAWEFIQEEDFRMVITDWMMPKMDGEELCRKIRAMCHQRYVYILLLTAKSGVDNLRVGFDAGADDYLTKPFNHLEFQARLKAAERILFNEDRVHEQEFSVRLECYNALTELAEMRDLETGAHIKRMGIYSEILAERLGMTKKYSKDIGIFAPMHDIGKVGIPDNILLAPRKLTKDEFGIMKTHSTLGWRILKGRETLELGAEIAYGHHEKYDGSGYPRGLKGRDIPPSCRIVALADVYDALRSKRPYKEPWTHQDAAKLIYSEEEKHFDPEVIGAFRRAEEDFREIFSQNREEDMP